MKDLIKMMISGDTSNRMRTVRYPDFLRHSEDQQTHPID